MIAGQSVLGVTSDDLAADDLLLKLMSGSEVTVSTIDANTLRAIDDTMLHGHTIHMRFIPDSPSATAGSYYIRATLLSGGSGGDVTPGHHDPAYWHTHHSLSPIPATVRPVFNTPMVSVTTE